MRIALFISLAIATATAVADELIEVHPTTPTDQSIDFIVGDTLKGYSSNVYNTLIGNAPATPHSRDLPKFSIIGSENKFYLSIGAQFKSTMNFDWGNPLMSPALFIPSELRQTPIGSGGKFDFTVQRSRLSFNFVGLPNTENQLGIYVALIFNGNNYGANINHAYVKYHGFTVGYTATLFCDQTAVPYTIDAQSPNSTATVSNTVAQYEQFLSPNIKVGAGLEVPMSSFTTNRETSTTTQRIPDLPLYLQYRWNGNSHIRLSSILRNMTYRNNMLNKNENVFGWGIKLSGITQHDRFTLYYMGKYGNGIASYIQDNINQGIDLTPDNSTQGKLTTAKSWAAFGAIQYNFSKKLFCTAIYSQLRNYVNSYEGGTTSYDDQYKYGQYIVGNLIWSPNKYIQTGLEYLWGRRVNFDKTQHHDNRIMAMFSVSL